MTGLNEAQNDTSHGIPTDAKGSSAWRKSQTFAHPMTALYVEMIESDFVLEAKLNESHQQTLASIQKRRADFIAEYEASKVPA